VLAATEMNQGATFVIVEGFGPKLPADLEVNIPLLIAWKDPIANTSSKYFSCWTTSFSPTEIEIISTPSAMAASTPARMSTRLQPDSQQTLYTAMRADGTPPLAVPEPSPNRFALGTRFPAAIDAQ